MVLLERPFVSVVLPHVRVTNTGSVRSAVTIQGYILDVRLTPASTEAVGAGASPPQRELFDFDKVMLNPGESAHVALKVPDAVLALGTAAGDLAVLAGEYDVAVGGLPLLEGAARITLKVREGAAKVLFSLVELQERHEASKN